jgi:hypothetical protein
MSTAPSASPEVLAVIKEFKGRLLPAKLKDTVMNGQLLAVWCNVHKGGVASAENMYEATKSIYASLEWDVPPAVLVRDQNEQKVNVVVPAFRQNDEFAAKIKAGEAADALKAKREDNLKKCRAAVSSFLPIDRRGHVLYGKKAEVEKLLNEYLDRQFANPNIDSTDVLGKVAAYIQDQYAALEKSGERL